MTPIQTAFSRWLLQASAIQVFLTLVSLPILVAWGLPLSYLTPVGTLLFTPILTVYLWCAFVVFCTTLCAIPNGFCIKALQYVSDWWLWMLGLIKTPWQIGFVCPPYALLFCIPISACAVVWYMRNRSLGYTTLYLIALLTFWIIALRILPQQKHVTVEHTNGKKLHVFNSNKQITIVDTDSCCSSMVDGANWIAYHALPIITQKTGASHIDHFIILHPRQRTFEALRNLIEKGMVRKISVPYWKGRIPLNAWKAYKELSSTAATYAHTINPLKNNKSMMIDKATQIISTTQNYYYGNAIYPAYILNT